MTPRKVLEDQPQRIPIQSAFEMRPWERGTALGLLAFGAAPMVIAWIRLFTMQFDMAIWIELSLLGLFTFVSIETISFILLKGFRRIDLPDSTMHWLGGIALVEVGPMAWCIITVSPTKPISRVESDGFALLGRRHQICMLRWLRV